jgi:hypothetical protein
MATWLNPTASQAKFTKHSSGITNSVDSPCHASTLQATDRETDPSSHRRHRTPHHHHRSHLHNLAKLIARDKAESTFWNCTRKPPKREQVACYLAVAWEVCLRLVLISNYSFSCRYSMSYDISISLLKKNFCKETLVKALEKGELIFQEKSRWSIKHDHHPY